MAVVYLVMVVAVFAGLVAADDPAPCCFPDQYTIHEEMVVTAFDNGTLLSAQTFGQRAYDAKNQLTAFRLEVYDLISERTEKYEEISLYPQQARYMIYNGKCTKVALQSPFEKQCVPPVATFQKTDTVGLGQFTYDQFTLTVSEGEDYEEVVHFRVSADECIPFQYSTYKRKGDAKRTPARYYAWTSPFFQRAIDKSTYTSVSESIQFTNYVAGIDDPSFWFKPPAECDTADIKRAVAAKKMSSKISNLFSSV